MNARLNPRKGLAAALLCALALGACGHKKTAVAPPQPGDRAVAMVNGAPVFASDVNREAVTQGLIGPGEPLDPSSDRFRQVLDEVVDQKLLAAEAVRRGLDKTPAVQRRLAAARERVLGDIVLENAVGRVVNDDAVKGLYAEMLKNTTASQEYRLRQIVVPTEVEADQVKTLLAGGGAFEAVAAQHSRDETTRFQGGVLPPLTQDLLPPGYAAALENAKPGQVVGPFKTAAGFVVVRLEDKRQEAPITLEAARPQIIRFLTFDQVKDLILDLRRRAKVQVLIAPPLSVPGAPTEPASAPPAVAPPTAASPAAPPPHAAATLPAVTTTPHAALMPARAAAPPHHAARTPQAEPTTPHAATTTPPKAPALQPPAPKTASTPPPKKPTVRPRAPKTATPPPPKAPGPQPPAPNTAT
jgi:peptidyl-prolyl cis-trans isomerase C